MKKRKLKVRARPLPVSTTSSTSEEETRQLAQSKRKPPPTKRARKQKEAVLRPATPKENLSPNKASKSQESLAADYSEVLKVQPMSK